MIHRPINFCSIIFAGIFCSLNYHKPILVLILLFQLTLLNGQEEHLSPRIANYKIDLVLDTGNKKIKAKQVVKWHNRTEDTIGDVYFHLYYNAFKNSESTFFKERGIPEFLTKGIDEDCGWSWTQIQKIVNRRGKDLSNSYTYVSPDDGNPSDQTVVRLVLDRAILPGDSIELKIDWEAKIPKTMIRTGYNKDFYFFAQWFPKLGVYEPAGMRYAESGQWNCHQYHSSGEYYADFGVYDVRMTVPSNYVVAASGVKINEEKDGDSKVVRFLAKDVIDFAWTCSPYFEIISDNFNDTEIELYCYPYKTHLAERYLPTIKFGMKYLEDRLGPYPYKKLSIIDPPIHGMFTGGMEYPTLITSLSFCFFPKGFRTPETLVIHEYIHQYFMQMVATHEVEDPWMDEGITSYYEGRILDELFTSQNSTIDFLGVKAGNKDYNRTEFLNSGNTKLASNAIKSWEYKHGGYGVIAYNKAAMWLQTLEGMIEQSLMDTIMYQYFNDWKFKHPDRYDFIDIVNEQVKEHRKDKFPNGMDWFFEQVLFSTNECDYAVASVENQKIPPQRGFVNTTEECAFIESDSDEFQSSVIFHRKGEVIIPQEIKVYFKDNSSKRFEWSGIERSYEIKLRTKSPISFVEIDPERKNMIDVNFLNNSLKVEQDKSQWMRLKFKFMTVMQNILESTSLFF